MYFWRAWVLQLFDLPVTRLQKPSEVSDRAPRTVCSVFFVYETAHSKTNNVRHHMILHNTIQGQLSGQNIYMQEQSEIE